MTNLTLIETLSELRKKYTVIMSPTTSARAKAKAGLTGAGLIGDLIPDDVPNVIGDVTNTDAGIIDTSGDIPATIDAIETFCVAGATPNVVGKLGDGRIAKALLELAKKWGPILIPLFI